METKAKEFEILGYKVRLNQSTTQDIAPEQVVDIVMDELATLKRANPSLEDGQAATLAALKIAGDRLILEKELNKDIVKLQSTAVDALHLIEEVSPTNF